MRQSASRILPFGISDAEVWGNFCARVGHVSYDLMIAATAHVVGATVVTCNGRHYDRTGVALVELPVT